MRTNSSFKNFTKTAGKLCLVGAVTGSLLVGCSINPTPFGFGKDSPTTRNPNEESKIKYQKDLTLHIARHLRCEARDVMLGAAAKIISQSNDPLLSKPVTLDDKNMAEAVLKNGNSIRNYAPWDIDPLLATRFSIIQTSALSMGFDLQMQEQNVGSLTPTLNPSGGAHPLTLKISAHKTDLIRKNQRKFDVKESQISRLQSVEWQRSCVWRYGSFRLIGV